MASTKAIADSPTRPKPTLTLPRSKVRGNVGSKVKLIVTGKVVEENLGEEWETPRRPTKRIEIQGVQPPQTPRSVRKAPSSSGGSSSTNSNRLRAKRGR